MATKKKDPTQEPTDDETTSTTFPPAGTVLNPDTNELERIAPPTDDD
jgi:hypothetical protein